MLQVIRFFFTMACLVCTLCHLDCLLCVFSSLSACLLNVKADTQGSYIQIVCLCRPLNLRQMRLCFDTFWTGWSL